MLGWAVLVILGSAAAVAALVGSGALRVRRYWWRLRLRRCRRVLEDRDGWGEPPPEGGVREPRRPLGPPPQADQIALDEPGR